VLPYPFRERELIRGGTPQGPSSLATPKGLDQRSKIDEVEPKWRNNYSTFPNNSIASSARKRLYQQETNKGNFMFHLPSSMPLFCLSLTLFIYYTSVLAWTYKLGHSKINKQRCCSARRGHRNAVIIDKQILTKSIIELVYLQDEKFFQRRKSIIRYFGDLIHG